MDGKPTDYLYLSTGDHRIMGYREAFTVTTERFELQIKSTDGEWQHEASFARFSDLILYARRSLPPELSEEIASLAEPID